MDVTVQKTRWPDHYQLRMIRVINGVSMDLMSLKHLAKPYGS